MLSLSRKRHQPASGDSSADDAGPGESTTAPRPATRVGRRAEGAQPGRRPALRRWLRTQYTTGMRSRVALTFALGALALSSAICGGIYFASRTVLIDEQIQTFRSQAFTNGVIVADALQSQAHPDIGVILSSLGPAQSYSIFYRNGRPPAYPNFIAPTPQQTPPPALVRAVLHGTPSEETYRQGTDIRYVVGFPIPSIKGSYIEDFDLSPLENTIHKILVALLIAAITTTLLGALLGMWAAGRAMRPLREVGDAAKAIAAGELDTRLETASASDLAALASSFNEMVDQLQDRIERDARFTSDVSHELRSPLTTLSASLGVLESRASEMPERAQRAVSLAGAEVRRFARMLSDLLEISRLDAGSNELVLDEVEVGELVQRTLSSIAGATGPQIPVAVEPEVESRHVLVDKRRFERIVGNLVENAGLYAGGATLVTVGLSGGSVRIGVEDHGPGIPPAERERIFERFSRGTSGRKRGVSDGAGLGLALVAEHARLHGGRVWVEEAAGGGALFVVELPMTPTATP